MDNYENKLFPLPGNPIYRNKNHQHGNGTRRQYAICDSNKSMNL